MNRRSLTLGSLGVALSGFIARATASPATPTPVVSPEQCEPVAEKTVGWIARGLTGDHTITGPAVAYRAPQFEKVWFVAANVDDKPAVWIINTITEDFGPVQSVNDQAKQTTDWFHADQTSIKLQPNEPGIAESLACLSLVSATPVASPSP